MKFQKTISLIEGLQQLYPESSKNNLKSWVEQGRVFVDETQIKSWNRSLLPGQELRIGKKLAFAKEGIKILYEDRYLVVIDKPEKLLAVASAAKSDLNVHAILKDRHEGVVFPVHRLDRETSGVMIFTYTKQAQDHIKTQFAERTVKKVYYAYVEGRLSVKKGTWRSYLIEDKNYSVRSSQYEGKLAITHYEVIAQKSHFSLLQFIPETGRKHQIRVHASDAGHPILGDTKYGVKTSCLRLCLHSHAVTFEHPFSKKILQFISPLPPIFNTVPKKLEKKF